MFKGNKFFLAILVAFYVSGSIFGADAVSVSQIQGLDTTRGLVVDQTIRYFIHYEVGLDTLTIFHNGFRIYSPDGASWSPTTAMELVPLSMFFDGVGSGINLFGNDGVGADSISLFGASIFGPGLESGFSGDLFFIQTMLSEEQVGKTLCLDSSFVALSGWLWGGGRIPSWDGPHCHEIVSCCVGHRGDINGDGKGPNIIDLSRLIDFIFRGLPEPECKLESDVDSDGLSSKITDLSFIVDYLFRGGPLPEPCP